MMSTSKVFELLHMDLFGPTQYTSIGGNKYGFVIVDNYTRYTWAFFLVDKRAFTMSLKQPSRELEVTMVVSSRILELMSYVMNLELDINSRQSTLHNQMALLRGRIEHLLIYQSLCFVSTMRVNLFRPKQSTRLAIVATTSIVTP